MKKNIILFSVLFLVTSCANISVHKTSDLNEKEKKNGVRFYRPKPYLKITTGGFSEKINTESTDITENTLFPDSNNPNEKTPMKITKKTTKVIPTESAILTYNYEIVWLPDYKEEYIIKWDGGIGSVKPNFTLEGGWKLTGFSSEVDTKIASTLTSLVGSYVSFKTANTKDAIPITPGIYPIEFKDGVLSVDREKPIIRFEK